MTSVRRREGACERVAGVVIVKAMPFLPLLRAGTSAAERLIAARMVAGSISVPRFLLQPVSATLHAEAYCVTVGRDVNEWCIRYGVVAPGVRCCKGQVLSHFCWLSNASKLLSTPALPSLDKRLTWIDHMSRRSSFSAKLADVWCCAVRL